MIKKIILLLILIGVLLSIIWFMINWHNELAYKEKLSNMPPEKVLQEYFSALNNHDKSMVKNIIYSDQKVDKFYWNVEKIQIIEMSELKGLNDNINSDNVIYKIKFEVNFPDSSSPSMPDGTYNWTFTLIKGNNNQWYLYDCGY